MDWIFFWLHENKRKRGRTTMKIIPESVKICTNCFTKIYRGCSYSASQCQYFRRIKVVNLMEISSPTTIQCAASCEQCLSEVTVTQLGWPKKVEDVEKEPFSSADWSGLQQDLGLSNSKTNVLLRDIRLVSGSHFITEKNSFAKIQQNYH